MTYARYKNMIVKGSNGHTDQYPNVLPDGWTWATLGNLSADVIGGGTPSRGEPKYFGGDIIWLTPSEIPKDRVSTLIDSRERITELGLKESSARLIPQGSVLLTSRASIGYVGIAGCEVTTNQGFASFVVNGSTYNRYLAYWLWGNNDVLESQAKGTTFKEISKTALKKLTIPLPPLPEQLRIVEKVEKLLDRVRNANTSIDKVPILLKQFRQAVIAAACSGKLIEQDSNDEPASVLLERIRVERKNKWDADLIAKGRGPKKHKYEEPAEPNMSELPELPSGWVWVTAEMLASSEPHSFTDGPFGSNLKTSDYTEKGARVIRLQNLGIAEFKDDLKAFVSRAKFLYLKKHEAKAGDIVIAALADPVGRTCIVPDGVGDAIVKADCIRLRVEPKICLNKYAMLALNTGDHFKRAEAAAHGVGRLRVNFSDVKAFVVPLPPLAEQRRIVTRVGELFKIAATIEAAVAKAKANSSNVTQSILVKAFGGNLVEQDPNDQPASELLDEIRKRKAIELRKEPIKKASRLKAKRSV